MGYERDIDKIYVDMTIEKQGQLIDSINNVLMNARQPVHLNGNITDEELKEFLNEYVRTDNEVFEEDIEHFDIRCPVEFLDKEAMISMDNDFNMAHTQPEMHALVSRLKAFDEPVTILLEYTGHYHYPVLKKLQDEGLPWCQISC